jgi:hypothetical protein
MSEQFLPSKREVSHEGKRDIGIEMIGIDRRDIIKMPLKTMVALHNIEVCTK